MYIFHVVTIPHMKEGCYCFHQTQKAPKWSWSEMKANLRESAVWSVGAIEKIKF